MTSRPRKTHPACLSGLVATAVLMGITGILFATEQLAFDKPWWLLTWPFAIAVTWMLDRTGRAGLPPRTRSTAAVLRHGALAGVCLALAEPQAVRISDRVAVLYLLDHSASIPDDVRDDMLAYVKAAGQTKREKDIAGLVVFGSQASMEVLPTDRLDVSKIYSFVKPDYTDAEAALTLAAAAFPTDARKKIVLLSDGNENKGSMLEGARFAAGNDVVIDALPISYRYGDEVLIDKVRLPERIREGEPFDMRVQVNASTAGKSTLAIYRNGEVLSREPVDLKAGDNTFTIPLLVNEPGFYGFTARIEGAERDTLTENNAASGHIYIQGESRLLFLAPSTLEVQHLADACKGQDFEIDIAHPSELPANLGNLQHYDAIILANVGVEFFTEAQMRMVQAAVRDLGIGLIMVGGENSFGAGGYEETPIEEALPVTMDIRQRKINPKGALAIILHTCEFPDGNYWAKEITKKAIDTVNRGDDVGVLVYDHKGDRWLFPLQPAANKNSLFAKISNANPGDMMSFGPTMKLGLNGLSQNDAMIKHMIIISDGDPASPTPEMIASYVDAGITISTIGINPHSPRDVDVLKFLAFKTNGRYYFAQDPSKLPQIFVKEAKVVKRALIFNEKFQPNLVLSSELTQGIHPETVPPLMAYVATTPKPRALVPMIADNEEKDPVLAHWRYGLGKSVAFTSDATSNWGKPWIGWENYDKIWSQIIRWTARKREKSDLRVRTELEGDQGKVIIDAIDADGEFVNFLELDGRLTGPDNEGNKVALSQVAPGRYEGRFNVDETGVHLLNIGYKDPASDKQGFLSAGVAVPYSAEYKTLNTNRAGLKQVAAEGGGKVLSGNAKEDRIFETDLPPTRLRLPIWEWLLLPALGLFFCDVVVRRVVLTREDLRLWLAGKKVQRAKQVDETMASLLKTKERVRERMDGAGEESAPADSAATATDFKSRLAASAQAAPKSGERGSDAFRRAEDDDQPKRAKVTHKTEAEPEEAEGGGYTSRLLAAKKRAQKKPPPDDEPPS